MVNLLCYHIKTISLWLDYWKSTEANKTKKPLPCLKNTHYLSGSTDFIVKSYALRTQTTRTPTESNRSKSTLFSVSRKDTLNIFTPRSDKKKMSRFWTGKLGKRGHLEAMYIKWNNLWERLSQKAVLGIVIWEMWEVHELFGELGSDTDMASLWPSLSAGACSSWSISILSTVL